MHKEKREKTTETYVPFPEGFHTIRFEPSEWPHELGRINLISILIDDEIAFVGAIQFHEGLKKVGNDPYPLAVTYIPEGGAIHFHVQGATRNFDNNVDPPFRFVFDGTCEETTEGIVLSGSGGVPQGFSSTGGPPEEPGESVTWTSRGPGDQNPKPSK